MSIESYAGFSVGDKVEIVNSNISGITGEILTIDPSSIYQFMLVNDKYGTIPVKLEEIEKIQPDNKSNSIKIISDGTVDGTKLLSQTGERIEDVVNIDIDTISGENSGEFITATVTFLAPDIEVEVNEDGLNTQLDLDKK